MKYCWMPLFMIAIFAGACSGDLRKKKKSTLDVHKTQNLPAVEVANFNNVREDLATIERLKQLRQENLQMSKCDSQLRIWCQVPFMDSGSITNLYKKDGKWFADNTVFGFRPSLNNLQKLFLTIDTQRAQIFDNKSNFLRLVDSLSIFEINKPSELNLAACTDGGGFIIEIKTGPDYKYLEFPICGKDDIRYNEIRRINALLKMTEKEFRFKICSVF